MRGILQERALLIPPKVKRVSRELLYGIGETDGVIGTQASKSDRASNHIKQGPSHHEEKHDE